MKVDAPAPASEALVRRDGTASWLLPVLVGGVLAVALVLRFLTTSDLWLDEALTVNIAKLPLNELRHALLRDGAPPLFYILLHGWMVIFGSGDLAVRSLSGALGVVMLGLTYTAGRRFGSTEIEHRWAAWSAVLVVASSPFAIRYSTEARMYMLAMVLVLLGYLALVRLIDEGMSAYPCTGVVLCTAGLLYTQYWSIFLLAVVGLILVLRAWRAPELERLRARQGLLAVAVGGLLFIPWIPTFLSQLEHTGTPWDTPTTPPTGAALGIIDFVGGKTVEGWSLVLVVVVLALLALFARSTGPRTLAIDLRTVPGVRWEWLVGVGTLFAGLILSFAGGTGFQSRYAAVIYPFFALAVACGVLVFTDTRIRIALLVFIVAVGFVGGARNVATNRTQASQVVDVITADSRPGDVVVACPDQLGPDTHRLTNRRLGLDEVVYPTLARPTFVDWFDYATRNAAANPAQFAQRILDRAAGHQIWVIWAPQYQTFTGQCEAMINAIAKTRGAGSDRVVADQKIYEFMGLRQFPAG